MKIVCHYYISKVAFRQPFRKKRIPLLFTNNLHLHLYKTIDKFVKIRYNKGIKGLREQIL